MQLKEVSAKFFAATLGIKVLSIFSWGILVVIIQATIVHKEQNLTQAGLLMSIIELLIGLSPVYLIWVVVFSFLRILLFKQMRVPFVTLLSLTLTLNLAELFFSFGHLDNLIRMVESYGCFNAKSWATLPDFPEILSVVLSSIMFVLLYRRLVEKNHMVIKS